MTQLNPTTDWGLLRASAKKKHRNFTHYLFQVSASFQSSQKICTAIKISLVVKPNRHHINTYSS